MQKIRNNWRDCELTDVFVALLIVRFGVLVARTISSSIRLSEREACVLMDEFIPIKVDWGWATTECAARRMLMETVFVFIF
jgi:hypothetical protein